MRCALLVLALISCGDQAPRPARHVPVSPRTTVAASDAAPAAEADCITDADASAHVAEAEEAARVGYDAGVTELIDSSCSKRVYQLGKYRIVVWKQPGGETGHSVSVGSSVPAACFERAMERAATVVTYGASLVAAGKKQYADTWADEDVGAARWLECDPTGTPSHASIATLLHEINHRLGATGCVHEFSDASQLCFTLAHDTLPKRSVARIGSLPGLPAHYVQAAKAVQDLYLGAIDQGPLSLLDELMAYRITAEVKAKDVSSVIQKSDSGVTRTLDHLALMMNLTVRYFSALRKSHPAVHAANRANVILLLDRAERSHRMWLDAMAAANHEPSKYERLFYASYQADRERWLGSR